MVVSEGRIHGLILLLIYVLAVTAFVCLVYNTFTYIDKYIGKEAANTGFNCSTSNLLPSCNVSVETNVTEISTTRGFLTTNKVSPISSPLVSQPSQYPLLYYYGHPSALYNSGRSSSLRSFPYYITTHYPTSSYPYITFGSDNFSTNATLDITNDFQQYSYLQETLSWNIEFTSATKNFLLSYELDDVALIPTNSPTLTTLLRSGTDISLIFTQGVPYMTITGTDEYDQHVVISTNNFTHSTITSNNGTVYQCWMMTQTTLFGSRTLALIYPSSNNATVSTSSTDVDLTISPPLLGGVRQYYYITIFKLIPSETVLVGIVSNLNVPIVVVSDISTNSTSSIVTATYNCSTLMNGGLLWIPPSTVHAVKGLEELHTFNTFFNVPFNLNVYLTVKSSNLQATSFHVNFLLLTVPNDFSYIVPSVNQVTEIQTNDINNFNDLYELTLTMRVMVANSITIPDEMSINVTTFWRNCMANLQYDPVGRSIRTDNLRGELGLISYFSYLVISYNNLYVISQSGVWSTTSVPYTIVTDPYYINLILAIIDSAFSTDSSKYFPLGYLDFYYWTVPTIDYISTNGGTYRSRFGESLSFVWAAHNILSTQQRTPVPSNYLSIIQTIYSIIAQTTPYLLRGECGNHTTIYPMLPWYGLREDTAFGFALDPWSQNNLGDSPDAVFIQSIIPVSPAVDHIITPVLRQYTISIMKILKCVQYQPPLVYSFQGYVDPAWTGYFLYLFDDSVNRTTLFTKGVIDATLQPFIKTSNPNNPVVALFLNGLKMLSPP